MTLRILLKVLVAYLVATLPVPEARAQAPRADAGANERDGPH